MLVTMRTNITGYRDGVPWPAVGQPIDVPDYEAEGLIANGYATPSGQDTAPARSAFDITKAKKPELVAFIAEHGLSVDPGLGVRDLRKAVAAALAPTQEGPDAHDQDHEPGDGSDGTPADPAASAAGDDDADPAGGPDLNQLTKAELIELAADRGIAVNPAWPVATILEALQGQPEGLKA